MVSLYQDQLNCEQGNAASLLLRTPLGEYTVLIRHSALGEWSLEDALVETCKIEILQAMYPQTGGGRGAQTPNVVLT